MPKKLVCTGKEQLQWAEYEERPVGPGQLRVRAEYAAAKHGTEMSFFKGYGVERGAYDRDYQLFQKELQERAPYPVAVGNMLVGSVEEIGAGVTRFAPGERVCVYSGFAETCVASEAACWKLAPGMSWKSAVCLDPAEFAFAAVRDGQVRLGDAVVVFGLGAIGLIAAQLVRLAGASLVIGVDPLPDRRNIAEALGVDLVLDPRAVDAGLEIKKATARRGADVIIEYSGSVHALQQALRGIAYGGNVVMGAYPPPYGAGLDLGAEAHMNVPNLIFTRACSQPDRDHPRWSEPRIFETCWRWLGEGRLTGDPIVQPVVAFGDLKEEYPKIVTQPDRYIKLGVAF